MNNIEIKSVRLRDSLWAQRSINHVCVPWLAGIGNSKLEGERTCVARRPKNVPATSGLNELLTTTCYAHTCSALQNEATLPCLPSTEPFLYMFESDCSN